MEKIYSVQSQTPTLLLSDTRHFSPISSHVFRFFANKSGLEWRVLVPGSQDRHKFKLTSTADNPKQASIWHYIGTFRSSTTVSQPFTLSQIFSNKYATQVKIVLTLFFQLNQFEPFMRYALDKTLEDIRRQRRPTCFSRDEINCIFNCFMAS